MAEDGSAKGIPNSRFEIPGEDREETTRGQGTSLVARMAPQVIVANPATVELLGNLGRRLASLRTDGPWPADPSLVRLGRHFRFLWDYSTMPGQQLIVSMTDLMNEHWATPLSAVERQSLPALAAYIDPPEGISGFDAAAAAEMTPVECLRSE